MTKFKTEIAEQRFSQLTSEQPTGNGQDVLDDAVTPESRHPGTQRLKNARLIPHNLIDRDPKQPRKDFPEEGLNELRDSIKTHGLLTPISVRFDPKSNKYIIISGERRWIASGRAGLAEMPCYVSEINSDSVKLARQLIENIQREDLSPIDRARGMFDLRDLMSKDSGKPVEWKEVEQMLGINERRRRQFLALLNLPEKIQMDIVAIGKRPSKNQVTEKHARALLRLNPYPKKQQQLFDKIKQTSSKPITGDDAMDIAQKMLGKTQRVHTFAVKYVTQKELLGKLQAEVKRLRTLIK